MGTYLRKRQAMRRQGERRDVFERYIGEIAQAINVINKTDAKKLYEALLSQAKKRTAIADMQLDEEGKKVEEDAGDQDGVIIVERAAKVGPVGSAAGGDAPDVRLTRAQKAALKVAAMAKEDDQPKLIDVDQPRRLTQKGKPPKSAGRGASGKPKPEPPRSAKAASAKSESKKTSPPPAGAVAAAAAPEAKSSKPKLRMRLVNGKLVPVDDGPQLF